jgi:DNA-directed RNA polymerase beta' subunit
MKKEKICCGVIEKMTINWMLLDDGMRCLPHIIGHDGERYKVNYCPSCGKEITEIMANNSKTTEELAKRQEEQYEVHELIESL